MLNFPKPVKNSILSNLDPVSLVRFVNSSKAMKEKYGKDAMFYNMNGSMYKRLKQKATLYEFNNFELNFVSNMIKKVYNFDGLDKFIDKNGKLLDENLEELPAFKDYKIKSMFELGVYTYDKKLILHNGNYSDDYIEDDDDSYGLDYVFDSLENVQRVFDIKSSGIEDNIMYIKDGKTFKYSPRVFPAFQTVTEEELYDFGRLLNKDKEIIEYYVNKAHEFYINHIKIREDVKKIYYHNTESVFVLTNSGALYKYFSNETPPIKFFKNGIKKVIIDTYATFAIDNKGRLFVANLNETGYFGIKIPKTQDFVQILPNLMVFNIFPCYARLYIFANLYI